MNLPREEGAGGVAPYAARLRAGLAELGLVLDEGRQSQLLAYLGLIQKWNRVYNLTALRSEEEMLSHHLMDSLAVIPAVRRHAAGRSLRILDVGAGAGLPGVVIAICCPEHQVECVDTVAKKAAFIQQVAAALALKNLQGVHSRVEKLAGPYSMICSRAFASLADFTAWSAQALGEGGVWMAMKGKHPAEEIAALPATVTVFHVEPLQVPDLSADRCLVWLKKSAPLT